MAQPREGADVSSWFRLSSGLDLLSRLIRCLPRRPAIALGRFLGMAWYVCDRRHRRVALANLTYAFGSEKSPRQIRLLARQTFRQFGLYAVDFFRIGRYVGGRDANWVVTSGEEHVAEARRLGKGIIYLTAHLGHWELLGVVHSSHGFPLTVVAREFESAGLNDTINRIRGLAGEEVVAKHRAARAVLSALRAGRGVAILLDQSAGELGVKVPFFGRLASTMPSAAAFALRTGAPVIPCYGVMESDGRYHMRFEPPLPVVERAEVQRSLVETTARFTAKIESWVRRYPTHWGWMHRRWKPSSQAKARGPFNKAERVLIKAPNWLGDAVMSLPAVGHVRGTLPEAHLAVLVRATLAQVYERCDQVDEVIAYPEARGLRGLARRWRMIASLRRRYFDAAILLPNSFESALWAVLMGIPTRLGTPTDGRRWLLTHWAARRPAQMHQAEHYLEIVRSLNAGPVETHEVRLRIRVEDERWAAEFLRGRGVNAGAPIVGLVPGASNDVVKRWPAERFREVARRLIKSDGAAIIVFGTQPEAGVVEAVAATLGPRVVNVCGLTTLDQLMTLLTRCAAVITNDTGPMHLAAALGTPAVAVFGPTDPRRSGPCGPSIIVRHEVACAPCLRSDCPTDHECMTGVTAEQVYEAVRSVLGRKGGT